MTTSIIDQPTFKGPEKPCEKQDQLEMTAYSDALVEFIKGAQTPLTIALQGEWGSGKTSLMNALKRDLVGYEEENVEGKNFLGVWVNTWQYSLLANPSQAILSIMSSMIKKIGGFVPSSNIEDKKRVFKVFGRVAAVALANLMGKVVGFGELGSEAVKAGEAVGKSPDEESEDVRNPIEALKHELQQLIELSLTANPGKTGVIFFIDDLDRIDPPVAVQILELLKNVFDLDKCIFVLAIDYGVVVKGLKSKFGEMTIANEREFRSFFDKIIQLPFAMPVGAYCIDKFLMNALAKIGYIKDANNKQLSKTLTDYALESVGTNPRSLKRLINSLSLMHLLAKKTAAKEDDTLFEKWNDIVFALECIKIQYPQVHTALERFCGFTDWGAEFAQAMGIKVLSKEESEKLRTSQGENFDEEWEQMLFALCKKDPFLESRALNISLMLNQIRTSILEGQENIADTIGVLLKLSSVTTVKSEPTAPAAVQTFNSSNLLKTLRESALGMTWRQTEDKKNSYWGARLADDVAVITWQKRVQSNLSFGVDISTNQEHPYKGAECWFAGQFRFETNGGRIGLKIWGEFRGYWKGGKLAAADFTKPDESQIIQSVEQTFRNAWTVFGVKEGNIGHWDHNFWFNVTLPLDSIETLHDERFGSSLRSSLTTVVRAFATLRPFCSEL